MSEYILQSSKRFTASGDYLKDLNPQQLQAVTAEDGPCMVIAGAGSGKTRVVTCRVAYLMEKGIPAENILLVTFTQKAAKEMLQRASGLISNDISKLWGGTFHHISNLILRKHASKIGFKSDYTILDNADSQDLINICRQETTPKQTGKLFPKARVLQDILGLSINTREHIKLVIDKKYPHLDEFTQDIQRVFSKYEKKKKNINALDFDDLLDKFLILLSENENIREFYSNSFRYILVDEYQDTNLLQSEILDILASRWRNLMVVGDDFQSIYSFRGARYDNILEFPQKYTDAKVFTVDINYRSTPHILNFANCVISSARHKFKKGLIPQRKEGVNPIVVPTIDVYQQASFIAQRIFELYEEGIRLSDIAVLYRAHFHSMELQMELTKRGIPFWTRSGLRFFEQAHIKDILSYMRIIENKKDQIPWMRLLKHIPKIGEVTADKIYNQMANSSHPFDLTAAKIGISKIAEGELNRLIQLLKKLDNEKMHTEPSSIIQTILKDIYTAYLETTYTDWSRRLEDIQQLARFAKTYSSCASFVSELALMGGIRAEDMFELKAEEKGLILSTVHQAKGLEWKVVFIMSLVEGYFPSYKAQNAEEREEEKRLFYVALTRAKDQLYLTYPVVSMRSNSPWSQNSPSSFLSEIDEGAYEEWSLK
ncbi:MAG: ATP-dependent helicase [Candidatus Omnitrophica bacterium]|nr:ATP-dependent helicase [Candidatus Omnitrophota bacterium]MBU1048284.1 ATP-dependent helicase [Candidatus Omnitrophota bacterium]MBU1630538.1 ATP-dependent helicase [Candidatus Omnitrophota bacterium]MBU1767010.1 ATP-dependent helicase [Candidatus Omnitrophota bacterium]MBU1888722.1 ATP-dependent helicase [Candidatus Omnitrophota bacterium]